MEYITASINQMNLALEEHLLTPDLGENHGREGCLEAAFTHRRGWPRMPTIDFCWLWPARRSCCSGLPSARHIDASTHGLQGGLMEQSKGSLQRILKADVRKQIGRPHRQSLSATAQDLGIHVIMIYKWLEAWRLQGDKGPSSLKDHEI
jgi:hypothetical protein